MKTKLFLTMLLAIASVGAKADEAQCILPWGADEPWQMKYVLDTNQPNDDYNTAGQRINKMQRGVNIADGKKVLF